jgi:hypothetical protein
MSPRGPTSQNGSINNSGFLNRLGNSDKLGRHKLSFNHNRYWRPLLLHLYGRFNHKLMHKHRSRWRRLRHLLGQSLLILVIVFLMLLLSGALRLLHQYLRDHNLLWHRNLI